MKISEPVILQGVVAAYSGNGRRLGYPTANIADVTDLDDGVYFGFANLGKFSGHPAMIFIGTPETMGDIVRRVEAYLLDIPDQDYYALPLLLDVRHFHRSNEKFQNVEELVRAIQQDEKAAREWFSNKQREDK